ncbi:hypothetical protein F2Q69_00013801 [Brassica cretica]|uniref:Uncharacterized protein n=1 Tax=Brassica cretica TaxID=69181 RepID=A0A8S9R2J6_BRACR|nr:hypothetical protein F2Q69_00013801 [Brassica cretica]
MTMLGPPARSQNRSPLGILGQNESRITFRNSGATLISALLLARSRDCTHRQFCYDWDDYDIVFYHAWQDVTIEPTRFIDWDFVRQVGIESDLKEMITELGLGHMATNTHDLSPDLCRYVTRGRVHARSPSTAGPSRQPEDAAEDDTDED